MANLINYVQNPIFQMQVLDALRIARKLRRCVE